MSITKSAASTVSAKSSRPDHRLPFGEWLKSQRQSTIDDFQTTQGQHGARRVWASDKKEKRNANND